MKIFKQLNKKGYKHYYEGTVEELDSMDKDNQHLHSEIMQVIMWLYEKHEIWVEVVKPVRQKLFRFNVDNKDNINEFTSVVCFNSPTEAYEAAIEYTLNKLI